MRIKIRILFIIILFYAVIQILIATGMLNPYWTQIIQFAQIITISAIGLNLIYGYTGQFSLGHAAFYGIGAYCSALVTKSLHNLGFLSFIIGLLSSVILVAIIALIIGLPILRLKSDYLGIATLGFGIIVKVLFDNADTVIPALGGSRGMLGIPRYTNFTLTFMFFIGSIIIIRNLIFSDFGRSFISIREDEIASECTGVNTTKYKTMGFVFGSIFAGVAGVLYAHLYSFLHPSNFDFLKSIDVLLIVVLGGLGSISGTIIAAIAWTFILEGLRVILPGQILDWRLVIYPLILIIIMLVKPMGIGSGREFKFLRPKE
jgi:branched-chain amino acid transport system permease protein|uniref:Branched-chain amino acid ABC transporter permease n=1 Tax=candidate division WOR-3 bacterium TaxID=2052148 RepID=A0A7V3RGJ2_UNCW3